MTDFVDPTVISQINAAKDELVAEIAKISASSDIIDAYAGSLPDPLIPEAPVDGNTYGRKDRAWVNIGNTGGGSWGAITGTLSDQTDLQNALDDKADISALADVATTGYYDDLLGKPSLIAEAPIDGTEYIRKDGVWANPAPVTLPANPNINGNINIFPASGGVNKNVTINTSQYTNSNNPLYIDGAGPFSGQFTWRVRFDNNGIAFSTDTAGKVWTPVGGGDADPTNLGKTTNATSVTITSSTGDNVTVDGASTYSAGVMTSADKTKLDGLENFSGSYTGNLTVRKNTSSYTVLVPTDGVDATFKTQFQGWSTASAWGSAAHQYNVNFKADGIYHQDVKGSGAERRLAFADELGGGGGGASSPIRSLFVSFGRQYTDNDGNPVTFSSTQNVITNGKTDFTCDAIKTGFNAISPALQVVDWHLSPNAGDLSYLPADALSGDHVSLKIMFSEGINSPNATLFCHFIDLGSTPNSKNGNVYARQMRGGAEVYDSGWKLISTSA